MKKRVFVRLFIVCMFSGCLAGCVGSQPAFIKVIDAQMKTPLSGVVTRWEQESRDVLSRSDHIGPVTLTLPASGKDGIINLVGMRGGPWHSSYIFTCSGYHSIYAFYENENLYVAENADGDDRHLFLRLLGPINVLPLNDGCVVVPMQK